MLFKKEQMVTRVAGIGNDVLFGPWTRGPRTISGKSAASRIERQKV
jgi:hypothetical protein